MNIFKSIAGWVAGLISKSTMSDNTILRGDGTWPWHAEIDSDDIVVQDVRITCFGGSNDPQDSGETASGISTKANPSLAACALPICYDGDSKALYAALGGSPIPHGIPWKTKVEVTVGNVTITVPVIDLGPAKKTGNALDLTIAAARQFKPSATATNFAVRGSYRIIGAAKYATGGTYA